MPSIDRDIADHGNSSHHSDECDTHSSTDEEHEAVEKQEQLAKSETAAVFKLRVLVILLLLAAATAISIVIYLITSHAENAEYEAQFDGVSAKVIEAFDDIMVNKMGSVTSLGVALVAYGADQSSSWPFVSLSSFQQRSATVRSLSGALMISVHPKVETSEKEAWEQYVAGRGSQWVEEAFEYQDEFRIDVNLGKFGNSSEPADKVINDDNATSWRMYFINREGETFIDNGPGPYLPYAETCPLIKDRFVNQNLARNPWLFQESVYSMEQSKVVIGNLVTSPPGDVNSDTFQTVVYSGLLSVSKEKPVAYAGDPLSNIFVPIFDSFKKGREAVAVMSALIRWGSYFEKILASNVKGVLVVLENPCAGAYTYEINGDECVYLGEGDLHDPNVASFKIQSSSFQNLEALADGTGPGLEVNSDYCPLSVHVYPSQVFVDSYITNTPIIITISVAVVFLFTILMFLVYDRLVEKRQKIVLNRAKQTTAIVKSLFPKNVTDRLLEDENEKSNGGFQSQNNRLKTFLNGGDQNSDNGNQPIADLFPNATVFFADIAGFTAWSSTREPTQVFTLLQTIYQAFDAIANKRKVFKVETIGDCYMAVTGLPNPQEQHALIMARFANDALVKMNALVRELEVALGPDTADLSLRVGLHSGPVTAGVLRGERARFQLFGDTVNTASRMESTGIRNKIQVSEATAQLLMNAGKEHWLKEREDAVKAKGKGILKTFWLYPTSSRKESVLETSDSSDNNGLESETFCRPHDDLTGMEQRRARLVDWVCEIIFDHMKYLIASKKSSTTNKMTESQPEDLTYKRDRKHTHVDELGENIVMQEFDLKTAEEALDHEAVEIDPQVKEELRKYISIVSATYRDNPFHNFEHACHVTMSVSKLLKRIVTPDLDVDSSAEERSSDGLLSKLHDYTYGINTDPLAQLAIIFSAVIHDADHRGVSNVQLMQEEPAMASLYNNQSVAEQNSLDVTWDLLMTGQFGHLRKCLFATRDDMKRFYQVLVNVVLATDIFDKELNQLRKERWNKAFHDESLSKSDAINLRATIVVEYMIQASDVSHTMQHWHVYRKWNERLFLEMMAAYHAGRMGTNPANFWYKGELGFFDNYIIPLAKKLKECNVFGVASDEYLNYAEKNRAEWAERGEEAVNEMLEKHRGKACKA